jgi:hypothetical protein
MSEACEGVCSVNRRNDKQLISRNEYWKECIEDRER